jgi:hypothetical protein
MITGQKILGALERVLDRWVMMSAPCHRDDAEIAEDPGRVRRETVRIVFWLDKGGLGVKEQMLHLF